MNDFLKSTRFKILAAVMIVLLMAGLVAGGLIFNALCLRFESVYPAWFAHMAANFAINTVGFILFGAL